MDWLTTEEASFYAAAWIVPFLVSMFRIHATDSTVSFSSSIGSSGVTAFFAFAVVALFCGKSEPDAISHHWYYLGLSALVGLAGPINQKAYHILLRKFGLDLEELEKDEEE